MLLTAAALFLVTLLQTSIFSVEALPGGAPRCIINMTTIMNGITRPGHGPMAALGFTMTAAQTTYTPGQLMAINLNNLPAFQTGGILAYVSQDSNPLNHVGQFMLTGALRAQTATICQGQNVVNDAATSTITHMNPLPNTNLATLMWTAPVANVGPVTVNAVVATGTVGKPWQIIPVLKLQPAAGATSAAASTSPSAANSGTNSNTASAMSNSKTKSSTPSSAAASTNSMTSSKAKSSSTPSAANPNSQTSSTTSSSSMSTKKKRNRNKSTSSSAMAAAPAAAAATSPAVAAPQAAAAVALPSGTMTVMVVPGMHVVVQTMSGAAPAAAATSPAAAMNFAADADGDADA